MLTSKGTNKAETRIADMGSAVSQYLDALRQRASSLKLLYENLRRLGPLPVEGQEITTSILRTLKTYYDVEDEVKWFLGKRVRGDAADFFVEILLIYIRAFIETHNLALEAVSEKSIRAKRGSPRPDISVWQGEQLVAVIECKTNLGWNRHEWQNDFIKREDKIHGHFPDATCFLVVLTGVNWPGFKDNPRVGDQYFTLSKIWPSDVNLDHPEDSIRNPVEPLFRQLRDLGREQASVQPTEVAVRHQQGPQSRKRIEAGSGRRTNGQGRR